MLKLSGLLVIVLDPKDFENCSGNVIPKKGEGGLIEQ